MSLEHSQQPWGGSHSRMIRRWWQAHLPQPCGRCGTTIRPGDQWVVGHIESRGAHPERTYDLSNTQPECRRCSESSKQQGVIDKAKAEALREAGLPAPPRRDVISRRPVISRGSVIRSSSGGALPAETSDVSRLSPEVEEPPPIPWGSLVDRPWLADLARIPADASPPLRMTPPHPDAVGSYGELAEKWCESELGLTLRWWQRLALRRLLEHDRAGALVWRSVLWSTPRRAGKSTAVMVACAWRMTHQELFGEEQTIVHCAMDRQAVVETMRQAWRWAESAGFTVRRANGAESIEFELSRWLLRSTLAVYGYPLCFGVVDEAWSVEASVVDDGLEPSMIHRASPQLLITSTAHRRATSLMRRRIGAAVAGMGTDWSTLLLLWSAPRGSDVDDPETWRAASPYWTAQQEQLLGDRLERARRGELDPQADDPDPVAGFCCQSLNQWPASNVGPPSREVRAVPEELWQSTRAALPEGVPTGAGIESTFADGLAVALAYPDEDGHVVSTREVPTMVAAVDVVLASGATSLLVGKSLTSDPALVDLGPVMVAPASSTSKRAVVEFRRLLRDAGVRHDASELLDRQVGSLMVTEGTEGPRVRSGCRVDAVKASVWAVECADAVIDPPRIY